MDELSGGKLAYVYMPDTAQGGLTSFNRYYFAQSDKQGAVIDERFNSGGQVADYVIEAMRRQLMGFWSPRYGAIYRTPAASILGPKVMIINEFAGSGGDAMPWMFRYTKIGTLVGKRTWGGLVGVSQYPPLMDGGNVTAPNFGFFSPEGQWDVENHGRRARRGSGDGPEAGARRPRSATGESGRHDPSTVGEESAGRRRSAPSSRTISVPRSRPRPPDPAAGKAPGKDRGADPRVRAGPPGPASGRLNECVGAKHRTTIFFGI